MSEFHTCLEVRFLPETSSAVWMLISPLVYESDVYGGTITVPMGFITDFVSFEPLKNIGQRAATTHDYLYGCSDFPKDLADKILKEALLYSGISKILAEEMYFAVKEFGASHRTGMPYTFFGKQQIT